MLPKVFLNGLFTMLITFGTAFLSHVTDSSVSSLSDVSDISWSVMTVGALITGFTQWKGFLSQPPRK